MNRARTFLPLFLLAFLILGTGAFKTIPASPPISIKGSELLSACTDGCDSALASCLAVATTQEEIDACNATYSNCIAACPVDPPPDTPTNTDPPPDTPTNTNPPPDTSTPTETDSPTPSPTRTRTPTMTATRTATPTLTGTNTAINKSVTPSRRGILGTPLENSETPTRTRTLTPTSFLLPSLTPQNTFTPSLTPVISYATKTPVPAQGSEENKSRFNVVTLFGIGFVVFGIGGLTWFVRDYMEKRRYR